MKGTHGYRQNGQVSSHERLPVDLRPVLHFKQPVRIDLRPPSGEAGLPGFSNFLLA